MNKVAFFSAVAATALGAVFGHLYLAQLEDEAAGGGRLSVLIATSDLKPGDVLTEQHLGVRQIPQAFVGARHIKSDSSKRIVGVRLNTPIAANEPILWSDVASLGTSGRNLSAAVQEGRRAFALGSSDSFDGLLRAGDRVDVLYTDKATSSTRTLLQDVMVLAVGGQMDPRSRRQSRGETVLSVDIQQSQLLATARTQGRLRLVLRNPGDIKIMEKLPESTLAQMSGTGKAEEPTVIRAPQPETKQIERVR